MDKSSLNPSGFSHNVMITMISKRNYDLTRQGLYVAANTMKETGRFVYLFMLIDKKPTIEGHNQTNWEQENKKILFSHCPDLEDGRIYHRYLIGHNIQAHAKEINRLVNHAGYKPDKCGFFLVAPDHSPELSVAWQSIANGNGQILCAKELYKTLQPQVF